VRRWPAFWVGVSSGALVTLDLSKINVALPALEHALGASALQVQLIVAGFILTFGLALVPMGRLGDQGLRRPLLLSAVLLFVMASAACALAPDAAVLAVARLVQGCSAGMLMPQVIGLLQELFQGRERAKAYGIFGGVIGVGTAFGPTLGGLAATLGGDEHGWRWIFWINVPLGLVVLAFAFRALPGRRLARAGRASLDPVGLVLFTLCVGSAMLPFLLTTGGEDDPARWWWLVAAALLLAAFIRWERHYAASGRLPLVVPDVLRIGSYRNGVLLGSAYYAAMLAMMLVVMLYLQLGLGIDPFVSGLTTLGYATTSALAAWAGGSFVHRVGRPLVNWGLLILLLAPCGIVATVLLAPDATSPWVLGASLTLAGVGGGLVNAPNQALTMEDVPAARGGLAGSMAQLGQRIGTAVGTAVVLSVFYAVAAGDAYRDAFSASLAVVAAFLCTGLAVGLIDHRHRGARAP
jgi:MFS family permease